MSYQKLASFLFIISTYLLATVHGLFFLDNIVKNNYNPSINQQPQNNDDFLSYYSDSPQRIRNTKRAPRENIPLELSSNHQKGILREPGLYRSVGSHGVAGKGALVPRTSAEIYTTNSGGGEDNIADDPHFPNINVINSKIKYCIQQLGNVNEHHPTHSASSKSKHARNLDNYRAPLCVRLFQCLASTDDGDNSGSQRMEFLKLLTVKLMPECSDIGSNEHDNGGFLKQRKMNKFTVRKRAPWAGAERRYDSLLNILGARLGTQAKKSSENVLQRNREDENRSQRSSRTQRLNSEKRSNSRDIVPDMRRDIVPDMRYAKQYASNLPDMFTLNEDADINLIGGNRDELFHYYDMENKADNSLEGYNVGDLDPTVRVRMKRDPESVADGGREDDAEFTEGTLGSYASDVALDTYASLLSSEYREARDVSDKGHSNRHIRPFVG